jgi:hypothetical protein
MPLKIHAMFRSISEDDFFRAGKDEAARTELIARLRKMKKLCTINALMQFLFAVLQAFIFWTGSPEAPREFFGLNPHSLAAIVGPICFIGAVVQLVYRTFHDGQIKMLILFDALARADRS